MSNSKPRNIGGWLLPLCLILPIASFTHLVMLSAIYENYIISKQFHLLTNPTLFENAGLWLVFFITRTVLFAVLAVLLSVTTYMFFAKRRVFIALFQLSLIVYSIALVVLSFMSGPMLSDSHIADASAEILVGLSMILIAIFIRTYADRTIRVSETFVYSSSNCPPLSFMLRAYIAGLILLLGLISKSITESIVGHVQSLVWLLAGMSFVLFIWVIFSRRIVRNRTDKKNIDKP